MTLASSAAQAPFRRLFGLMTALYWLQVLILGYCLSRFHDPGTLLGFVYALLSALMLSWGFTQLQSARVQRAADVLFITVLSADALAALYSPSNWACGIVPVLAVSLLLPYFSGAALRRRLLAAFLTVVAGITLHPLFQQQSQAPGFFLRWYPVVTTTMAVSLLLYALLLFHRSLRHDLAEGKLARESAAASQRRSRRLIEASGRGVWVMDGAGHDLFVNEKLVRMLGGEAGSAGVAGRLEEESRDLLESALSGRRTASEAFEVAFRRFDGSRIRAWLSLSFLKEADGSVNSVLALLRDISGKSAMDEQLRQAERLEDVARLAASLSGELEAQLKGVSEGARQLEPLLDAGSALHEDLGAIKNAESRVQGLLRQLKAFSQKQKLLPELFDLAGLIHSMRPTLERACGRQVTLSVDAPRGLGFMRADPSQIEQVLLNLAINARDAMPQGGRLELRLEKVHAGLRLRVSDNGSGIEPASLSRVFEPFFSTKGRGQGSGLGLATVYGIVRQSGGSITLKSPAGHGTEAEIHFPLAAGPA